MNSYKFKSTILKYIYLFFFSELLPILLYTNFMELGSSHWIPCLDVDRTTTHICSGVLWITYKKLLPNKKCDWEQFKDCQKNEERTILVNIWMQMRFISQCFQSKIS